MRKRRMTIVKYDFSGWATKNNLKCSDGRTILQDAFKHNDGQTVPLVWNHQHNDPHNVLGHALLENRPEGVYAYCKFNDTPQGKNAKQLVEHGDVSALSIYANQLKQLKGNVTHGVIREVSLVLAGANPGAFIDSILRHGECSDEEGVIYTGEELELAHADAVVEEKEDDKEENMSKENQEKTVQDVVDSMTEEQRNVMYALIGQVVEENKNNNENGGKEEMKHNVFENQNETNNNEVLTHSEMEAILRDAKRYGSLKESCLQHGIEHIDEAGYLFPEFKNLNREPEFVGRDLGWVAKVMNAVHRTPFSRIKSLQADIREEEARALGYMKGNLKKEEVFSLLKRTTDPQTIYKKQKLHRDDVLDITDFDVVAFIKKEMRMMLEEEIARAILIGDGRLPDSDDKIQQNHIRSIANEEELYCIKKDVVAAEGQDKAKEFIKTAIRARKDYKGSGEPTLFIGEEMLVEMLLLEDKNGRVIYESEANLARALRVKEIVSVPVMEGAQNLDKTKNILGIIVNLKDYNVGADKGGQVSMFEDFDIDYNAQKYLIETRCSGALIKPFSAIVLQEDAQ
jgi:HK97 family phage prohead protease